MPILPATSSAIIPGIASSLEPSRSKIGLLLAVLMLAATLSQVCAADADEIALYDAGGKATAYIAEELTIYTWAGKPVAYLERDALGGLSVYGFNGKHLGWLVGQVLHDHGGNAVGATAQAFVTPPAFAPFKGFKQFKPFKGLKELALLKPLMMNTWSDLSLQLFFLQGAAQ